MASIPHGSHLGPYQVENLIGKGGMGEVYRAHDTRLDRAVALKVLAPEFSSDADRLARFTEEARTTALLNHPNIIAVYDVGTHLGMPFVVSELLDGETLRARLTHGRLGVRATLAYGLELARGLAAAHRLGVVHHDLKPENVFITRDDRVKILDFGLATCRRAALACAGPESSTAAGRGIIGTIGYAAPEQVRGGDTDHRADIFSLGVMLYEMAAGTPPFRAASPIDTVVATLHDEPAPLVSCRAMPRAFEDVVRHCLEKHATARFQTAHDLAFSLDSILRGIGDAAAPRMRRAWPSVSGVLRNRFANLLNLI
jgi:eukaryotic-like serine/threonine-protein kinase